ncbi:MAG: thioredoxin-disulfide reductase [Nitrospinota bacterium]|nr:thioredoxin-disulfide reductase [Nitrospinota bacterium]
MHDLVIIGGGAAGLSAAIYALRARLDVLLIEKMGIGGQIMTADIIENYPGFKSLSGMELMQKFEEQANDLGLRTEYKTVNKIIDERNKKIIKTDGGDIEAMAVIIATGANPKKLGVAGEEKFTGRGVSYCATCDGPFYKDKNVVVIGGGDTAVKEANYLTKIAAKVTLVHRRDRLRAEKIMQEALLANPKVEFAWYSVLEEIYGDDSGVTGVKIKNVNDGVRAIDTDGVFVFVGIETDTSFVDVEKTEQNFIVVNSKMETSVKGIYAVGDVRNTPLRQVATAVGDGAIAAVMAEEYISRLKGESYPARD